MPYALSLCPLRYTKKGSVDSLEGEKAATICFYYVDTG